MSNAIHEDFSHIVTDAAEIDRLTVIDGVGHDRDGGKVIITASRSYRDTAGAITIRSATVDVSTSGVGSLKDRITAALRTICGELSDPRATRTFQANKDGLRSQ